MLDAWFHGPLEWACGSASFNRNQPQSAMNDCFHTPKQLRRDDLIQPHAGLAGKGGNDGFVHVRSNDCRADVANGPDCSDYESRRTESLASTQHQQNEQFFLDLFAKRT